MVSSDVRFDSDLENELRHIDRNLINRATVAALKKIARPLLKTLKNEVATDTHVLQQALSLTSEVNKSHGVAVVYAGLSKKNHPGWLITRGLAVEYGNAIVAPQPFLARAARQHRAPVYEAFRKYFDEHLEKLI